MEDFKLKGAYSSLFFYKFGGQIKGTLRISHMIPVPESELIFYDLEKEKDETYKDLVNNEVIFIRRNEDKIYKNVELIYKQKAENATSAGYVKSALNYKELEKGSVSIRYNDMQKL